jgi:hypothetical protein
MSVVKATDMSVVKATDKSIVKAQIFRSDPEEDYTLLDTLGSGSFGSVVKVR